MLTKYRRELSNSLLKAEASKLNYFLANVLKSGEIEWELDDPLFFEEELTKVFTSNFTARFQQVLTAAINSGKFAAAMEIGYSSNITPELLDKNIESVIDLLSREFDLDWSNAFRGDVRTILEGIYSAAGGAAIASTGLLVPEKFIFTLKDELALNQLSSMGVFWASNGAKKLIITDVVTNAAREALEMGLSTYDAGEIMKQSLRELVPKRADLYYQNLASIAVNRARNWSRIYEYQQLGITHVTWNGFADARQCARCAALDGTTFETAHLAAAVDRAIAATTPEELIDVNPFINSIDKEGNFVLANGERVPMDASSEALAHFGILPPAHGDCRCFITAYII